MATIYEKIFGAAAIRLALKAKGISQKDISGQCKVTEGFVSQVIDGKRRSKSVEDAIAQVIGEPADELFEEVKA